MQSETKRLDQGLFSPSKLIRFLTTGMGLFLATILLGSLVCLAALFWAGPEGYFILYPAIDTRFAPGYSEANFRKVQPGMSKDEVLQLLGQPFNDVAHQAWIYSEDGAFPFWDFAWLARGINFDSEGRVIERSEHIFYN